MSYIECDVPGFNEEAFDKLDVNIEEVEPVLSYAPPPKMDASCQCQTEPPVDREFQFRVAKFLYNARPDMRWSLTNKMIRWLELDSI